MTENKIFKFELQKEDLLSSDDDTDVSDMFLSAAQRRKEKVCFRTLLKSISYGQKFVESIIYFELFETYDFITNYKSHTSKYETSKMSFQF